MNILLVTEYFYPYGGAELSLWRLCGVLSQKGHKIYVITARRNGETDYEVKDGIEIYRPFSTGNTMQRFIFAMKLYPYLKKWLRGKDIDGDFYHPLRQTQCAGCPVPGFSKKSGMSD